MAPVYTSKLAPRPGRVLVAKKLQQPLTIVLDPATVPDSFTTKEGQVKAIRIHEIHEFVRRDLKAAMENFFEHVQVVDKDTPVPAGHQLHLSIERFEGHAELMSAGAYSAGRVFGRMTWSVALLPHGDPDYLFSYTDTATGDYSLVHVREAPAMIEATYRVALQRLLSRMTDDKVPHQLRDIDGGPEKPRRKDSPADRTW